MQVANGVKVLSFFPGRVRLRVDALKGDRGLVEAVELRLAKIPGISHVEAHATSASLLVKYDARQIGRPASAQALTAALRELFPGVDVSRLQHWLTSA